MHEAEYRLEMIDISKHFGGVKALDHVSLRVKPGQVHALIGENGAGKSTLMKILSGAYSRDHGQILIDGKEAKITNPTDAKNLGVTIIYQEFMLAPDLTVAENIFIDRLSGNGKLINWKKLRAEAKEQLSQLGFDDIDPGAKCGSLSVAYQQVVEICKCLTRNAKILVFDYNGPRDSDHGRKKDREYGRISKSKERGNRPWHEQHTARSSRQNWCWRY